MSTEESAAEETLKKAGEEHLRSLGRAISPEEKRVVIERILKIWEQCPYSRLGQLIVNATRFDYLFYVEDYILCESLENFQKDSDK